VVQDERHAGAQEAREFSHLLSPIEVGPATLRNRVLVSAHQPGLAEDGVPGDRYVAYQRTLAAGGPGLQITGATAVHPTGTYHGAHFLLNFDDSIIPGYRRMAVAVHEEGGRILAQLGHAGAIAMSSLTERPLWAPSPVASELVRETPHEMTHGEIAEVVAAFGDAARRVREGDLDGIEITASHGALIAAFLSPYSNHRTDGYGSNPEGRLRFLLEVLDAVSEQAGPDLIVGVRVAGDEGVESGIDLPQAQEIARRLEATGKVHYLSVIAGTNLDRFQRVAHWPATPAPHGLFVHLAEGIKGAVGIPVFAVGRVTDPAHAERILAAGSADVVGMTRAHIADPRIVEKLRQGRPDDIRPCVGANVCIRNNLEGLPVRCIHNPEAGREAEWGPLLPARRPKRVTVVGGGPAGLEAARVAALRGHSVTLFERQNELGGQLRLWAKAPAMGELRGILRWQEAQLEKLGVEVCLGQEVSPDTVLTSGAEAVVVATGSKPLAPGSRPETKMLPGAEDSPVHVVTPHDALEGKLGDVGKAVVWDAVGGSLAGSQAALSAAEALARAGAEVRVIYPGFAVGEDVHLTMRTPLYGRLLSAGVEFIPNSDVSGLDGPEVKVRNIYTGEEYGVQGVDALVAWLGSRAQDSLWPALRGQVGELHAAGDCLAPRSVEAAMTEGAEIARAL
jgi:2,4-dienoyl-CoA reductase-like NADH-dependent reductase (Old Yellow Enzyme family)/thioredoxin reductase